MRMPVNIEIKQINLQSHREMDLIVFEHARSMLQMIVKPLPQVCDAVNLPAHYLPNFYANLTQARYS